MSAVFYNDQLYDKTILYKEKFIKTIDLGIYKYYNYLGLN